MGCDSGGDVVGVRDRPVEVCVWSRRRISIMTMFGRIGLRFGGIASLSVLSVGYARRQSSSCAGRLCAEANGHARRNAFTPSFPLRPQRSVPTPFSSDATCFPCLVPVQPPPRPSRTAYLIRLICKLAPGIFIDRDDRGAETDRAGWSHMLRFGTSGARGSVRSDTTGYLGSSTLPD